MERFLPLSALVLLTGSGLPMPQVQADGFIVVDPPHWRPPPHLSPLPWPAPRSYIFAPLEVIYHRVNMKIGSQVATTSVDQEFYNSNPSQLEGTYLLRLPKDPQIDKFSMDAVAKCFSSCWTAQCLRFMNEPKIGDL